MGTPLTLSLPHLKLVWRSQSAQLKRDLGTTAKPLCFPNEKRSWAGLTSSASQLGSRRRVGPHSHPPWATCLVLVHSNNLTNK